MLKFKTIKYENHILSILDQRLLPNRIVYFKAKTAHDVYRAIKDMVLRGAPLIGVAAAWGIALEAQRLPEKAFVKRLMLAIKLIRSARPTARNLFWACGRMKRIVQHFSLTPKVLRQKLVAEAKKIEAEDIRACEAISKYGAVLIKSGFKIMVHCNAGALATAGIGTALGILYEAQTQGKEFTVYVCETRPWLQGARLSTWELHRAGIETLLLCDNMISNFIEDVDLVIVGADRIATNGDVANKIGTKNLAIIANYYQVPFYVAAPIPTFDKNIDDGKKIPIEYRAETEVKFLVGQRLAPKAVKALNPAFDVTPHQLITGIITDQGLIHPPYKEAIKKLVLLK